MRDWLLPEMPPEVDASATSVVDAVVKVRKVLGVGLKESYYKRALRIELGRRGHAVVPEASYDVLYEGENIGFGAADFLVDGHLVVEAKAVESLHPAHVAQTLTYVHGLSVPLGLLVNFHAVPLSVGIQRVAARRSV